MTLVALIGALVLLLLRRELALRARQRAWLREARETHWADCDRIGRQS